MHKFHRINKDIVVLLYRDRRNEICNFSFETCKYLGKNKVVIAVLINEPITIFQLFTQKNKFFQREHGFIYLRFLHILPFQRLRIIYDINQLLFFFLLTLCLHGLKKPNMSMFLWMFSPEDFIIFEALKQYYITVYDVVDYRCAKEFNLSSQLQNNEIKILSSATIVSTISDKLLSYAKKYSKKAVKVPQGFSTELYKRTHLYKSLANEFRVSADMPLITFIGGINHRLDYELLKKVVAACPNFYFVFVGPVQSYLDSNVYRNTSVTHNYVNEFRQYRNVLFLGEVEKKYIPSILSQSKVGIIPYDMKQEFNQYCFPMKFFEYMYSGLPILSTNIPELMKYNTNVYVSNSPEKWITVLKQITRKKILKHELTVQRNIATAHSWQNKIETILLEMYEH